MAVGKKPVLGGRMSVKVAIVQKAPRFLDKGSFVEPGGDLHRRGRVAPSLSFFRKHGSRVIRTGPKGGTPLCSPGSEAVSPFAMPLSSRPVRTPSGSGVAARRANAYVVMGCNEIDPRPEVSTIYNTLLFFDPEGTIDWPPSQDYADLLRTDVLGSRRCRRPAGLRYGYRPDRRPDLRRAVMTLMRAAMIGLGEDIHIAAFPGAFALHTGPEFEEWDADHSSFWGHSSVRAHALEAGAFVISACGIIDDADIPDEFPQKAK